MPLPGFDAARLNPASSPGCLGVWRGYDGEGSRVRLALESAASNGFSHARYIRIACDRSGSGYPNLDGPLADRSRDL